MNARPASAHAIAATLEALGHLFALLRQIALEGAEARGAREAAAVLAQALARAEPPFALQWLVETTMRDRVPLPLGLEEYRRAQHVALAFERLGAQELAVDRVPSVNDLCDLGAALSSAANKGRSLRLPEIPGLRLSALSGLRTGAPAGDEAVLEQVIAEQVARACAEADALALGAAWSWSVARTLAFRLERCLITSISATARALELGPFPWTRGRRAVVAAFHTGAVLGRLQVSPLSQRAATHAALALATHGLAERDSSPFASAAQAAWRSLLAGDEGRELDPHRLRVCALVRACSGAMPKGAAPLVPLLHAAYELERKRCPAEAGVRLSRVDLQAWLADAIGAEVDDAAGRALFGLLGALPIGSHVLSDGRLGVVFGSSESGDARRPRVLVGGQIGTPANAIALHSPLGVTAGD